MILSRLAVDSLLVAAGLAGCLGPAPTVPALPPGALVRHVYIVQHAWHTRVAVRQADVDPALWPESRDLGDVTWLDVGWGDRDYYPDPDPSVWDAVDAVIRPTPAVLHVGGFDRAPPEFLAGLPMVRIAVSRRGLDGLARFVHAAYERRGGRPVRIGPGTYPISAFYLATGRYHALFNNSNAWTARALRAAGVPVGPGLAITADSLMRQAARMGTRLP
ncbi:MAG: DUF2459 domain-containing protein [Candidatus Rokuibacteriota bacterium]